MTPTKRKTVASKIKEASDKTAPPHLIAEARAGTGKTTTLIEGLKAMRGLPTSITPSEQQARIWESLKLSSDAKTVCFVAFNKSIATELQARVPVGCEAMTMHSMGFRAVNAAFKRLNVSEYRVNDLLATELGIDAKELRKERPVLLGAVKKLVSLVKMNLADPDDPAALNEIVERHDIEMGNERAEVYSLVPRILDRCRDPQADGRIDYADMVWLPVALNLPVTRYDLLLVDESQDLNRCQQALAKAAGRRLVLVGDPAQSIYGFAGADSESMSRMYNELKASAQGCDVLPLTVTRRCGKAIVAEARQYVPAFSAHESNPEGIVRKAQFPIQPAGAWPGKEKIDIGDEKSYISEARDGDFALCRTNAPLVNQCFRFLKRGMKATIQGSDIGQGLISLIKKLDAKGIPQFIEKLQAWLSRETNKEHAKKFPSETNLQLLEDKHDCLLVFADNCDSVDAMVRKIEDIFTDDKQKTGVRFSSIHKAKGLEAKRVFYLRPAAFPGWQGEKQAWEEEQEKNLRYVAITRAIEELIYVV